MKKEMEKHSKKKEIESVINYILDNNRDRALVNEYLPSIVAIVALAYKTKTIQDTNDVIGNISINLHNETTLSYLRAKYKENISLINALASRYDENVLKSVALFTEPKLFTELGDISTPDGISDLALSLMALSKNDVLLDLGSGVSSFLMKAAKEKDVEKLYGVEINTNNVIVANIRKYLLDLNIDVIQGNIISQDFSYLKATKVFSNFPWGLRLSNLDQYIKQNEQLTRYLKNAPRTISGDWIFGISAYLNASEYGKTVILMSNAGTWNISDISIRKMLIEEGVIEAVILMPENLFTSTNISTIMLVLSKNNKKITMVDASNTFTKGRRVNTLSKNNIKKIYEACVKESDISRKVLLSEIRKQEYILNPLRYTNISNVYETIDGVSLGDVCLSINRGSMITSAELDNLVTEKNTKFHYLMLQNIKNGIIDENLPNLIKIDSKYEKYCIKDKCLIISKISPFKVSMARIKNGELILANGNLYFLEIDEKKANPIYVQVFLQSERGISLLNKFSKGAAMKSISIQDLKSIMIPNIPLAKQKQIAEEYMNIEEELEIVKRQYDLISERKTKLLEEVL